MLGRARSWRDIRKSLDALELLTCRHSSSYGIRALAVTLSETFLALTVEMLSHYLDLHQEENLHLDFKLLDGGPDLGNRNDRKTLAVAFSGFANASGGLIVWGVDARKNDDGIDCVTDLPGVPNTALLLARLNELTGEAVDPIADGVEHRIIGTLDNGRGFLVTMVPGSDSGPHMAKLGENRYYKRSGDSFYPLEHYDIADMFGRRPKPLLKLTYRIRNPGPAAEVIVGLKNHGRSSARAPYLSVSSGAPFHQHWAGLDGNRHEGLPLLIEQCRPGTWRYGARSGFVIHPGVSHEVLSLTRESNRTPVPPAGVEIQYEIACDDQPLTEGRLIVPARDVEA